MLAMTENSVWVVYSFVCCHYV